MIGDDSIFFFRFEIIIPTMIQLFMNERFLERTTVLVIDKDEIRNKSVTF